MQWIASCQSEIEDPNTGEGMREVLKKEMQEYKRTIRNYNLQLGRCETEIKQIETEIKQIEIIENKGESII